jgi:hypothetical protein
MVLSGRAAAQAREEGGEKFALDAMIHAEIYAERQVGCVGMGERILARLDER